MTARARACLRRDWSVDVSCGHRWRTALSRSALRNYPISCPELTGGCRRQPGVRRLPVKLWLFDSQRKSGGILSGEYGWLVSVTTPSDPLPADLAAAHAMILAQRELLTLAKSEVTVGRLEIERLKLMLAKARREQFGQSSERGRLLVEQLELAIEDLEETRPSRKPRPRLRHQKQPSRSAHKIRGRLDVPCQITCRSNVSSNPRLAPAVNVAVSGCTSLARWYRRLWNASRVAGRLSSMSAKSSPAGIARRSPRRRRPCIRSREVLPDRACWQWYWSTSSCCISR